MQIMITGSRLARTRVLNIGRWQLAGIALALPALLLLLAAALPSAWRPALPRPQVLPGAPAQTRADDAASRERFLRENLAAMATRLGEMQAKLVKLEAIGERVSGLAGVKPEELREIVKPTSDGRGGPFVPLAAPSRQQLDSALDALDENVERHLDLFTLIESRLFEDKLAKLTIPNSRPVEATIGSGFGMRTDPFSGRTALHTGLDFAADSGTPIVAAAGGVVIGSDVHPAYGQQLQIDHGNGLVTRYAHCSKVLVGVGDIVRRGQKVALVGSTGRSTGPHLHFEVLLDGVPQNPAKFLAGGGTRTAASRGRR